MSYFTLSNGEKIYYEDTGKGEQTVILMHGWTSTHEVFAPCVPAISEKARCITFDHRGHGGSREANQDHVTMDTLASDLDELIRGLGLRNVTLVGWSMGAAVAMDYMSAYGCDALRQVVLCDMTPKQVNDDSWDLGLYQGRYTKEDMKREAGKDFYGLYKSFAIGAIPRLAKIPGFLLKRPLKEKLSACDEKTLRTLSVSMKAKDYRQSLEAVTVPACYFYAVPGSLYSPKLADWYRAHIHTPFQAVAFENSTHMLITDHPDQFAAEIIKILEAE